jgi:mRNA interferase RelE/StbE
VESYKVLIKPSAVKEIERIPKTDRIRVVERIQDLAQNSRPPGCPKLSDQERYRVRQGDYRIVFSVDDGAGTVLIVKVAHRREVYR